VSILILFGTQTGNSELLAGEVARSLRDEGRQVRVVDMADAYPEILEETDHLIVVMCTWADGTFPDNAVAFWESFEEVEPDCSRLSYGIVGLGDRLYDPYYQVAVYRLADRLDALGARRAIDHYEIDGQVRPSHRAAIRRWASRCARAFDGVSEPG
jgi:sulfite reductase alpha subunit-like flavoprotein